MTETQWERIQRLFEGARARPRGDRGAYLAEACDDPGVRRLVAEMLEADASAALRLESSPLVRDSTEEAPPPSPETIGGYRLRRQLGRGGMADVYLAESEDPSDPAPVAIKVLRQARADPDMVRRFEAETAFLRRLQHPNIARFRGAGVTRDGLPYLAMDYVDGEPLHEYGVRARPTLAARLGQFRAVCSAVHYAHGAGVLHRDLKPSNVLVTPAGDVVLLDFGIGKLLNAPPDGGTPIIITPPGVRLLTPSHAAPEQVRGQPPSVRTDVYGLGLLLYELLTGAPAFPTHGVNWFEWERRVLEVDPPLPSEVARAPDSADQERLRDALRGELDRIVMKALRKKPSERFASVQAFSERFEAYAKGTVT